MTSLIYLLILLLLIHLSSAHMALNYPLPRGHPRNPNTAKPDEKCLTAPLNGGGECSPKVFPCGGYPQDKIITQTFRAGQIINVTFWNAEFPNGFQEGEQEIPIILMADRYLSNSYYDPIKTLENNKNKIIKKIIKQKKIKIENSRIEFSAKKFY